MSQYRTELVEYCQEHPFVTWEDLVEHFERPKRNICTTLNRGGQDALIERIDKHSGTYNTRRSSYWKRLVHYIEADSDVDWATLSVLFNNRTEESLKRVLYSKGRKDLVRQVDRSSK